MHDFGVSKEHTIIMDLPLSLDPLNLLHGKPAVAYDPTTKSRFGVFPRYEPNEVTWFETNPCCIFHTANTWDTVEKCWRTGAVEKQVHLLACRLTSASIVYSAGNLTAPTPTKQIPHQYQEEEQCRLYYYQFILKNSDLPLANTSDPQIRHQWALSTLSFEFPTLRDSVSMTSARYIYGCTTALPTFSAALGRATKISYLAKFDVQALIASGIRDPPTQIKGSVDTRSIKEIINSADPNDPIKVFEFPSYYYGQEASFVPRQNGTEEDDGWLLTYVFDERQVDADGECRVDAHSELWIIDARNMKDVVAKIRLPTRVPYGLHGKWFPEEQVRSQRPVHEFRQVPSQSAGAAHQSVAWRAWLRGRIVVERWLA